MYKRKKTGKIRSILFSVLLVMILAGCGAEKGQKEEMSEDQRQEAEQKEQTEQAGDEALQEKREKAFPQEERSCFIEEDADYLYICGSYQLLKINKATGEENILWENREDREGWTYSLYLEGQGFLFGDRLYFIEAYRDEESDSECRALSVIRTDGTGYQRLHSLPSYSLGSMVLLGEELYVNAPDEEGNDGWLCCHMQEDGSLSESSRPELEAFVQQGYRQITYEDNGRQELLMPEAEEKFGYLLLENQDYELVKLDPKSGEEEKLPKELFGLEACYEEKLLFAADNQFTLIDSNTLQAIKTIPYDDSVGDIEVITMDGEFIYAAYVTEDDGEHTQKRVFEKISLETGSGSVIFEQERMRGVGVTFPTYLSDVMVKNGYLYYVGAEDYQLYLMRRSLENPSREEKLGEAFYDSGIKEAGTIKSYYKKTYSETMPDVLLTETDLEWLQVDSRFAGADKINRYLEEEQNKNIEYVNGDTEWLEEVLEEYGEDSIFYCSYSSTLSGISYFDGRYLSFCQNEYDYQGGAHGMPYWIGFTFDLDTGERLSLPDIIANSEEELNSIVTRYFAEYIDKYANEFWEGALDTVREEICFASDFYLTEDGIKFYFHPYALSYYAFGFPEVTVPYEEFEMKIPLVQGDRG